MRRREGWALLFVMFATLLLSAIGLALGLAVSYDALASGNVRSAGVAFHGAEAGFERALLDLPQIPDWEPILSGTLFSSFTDGAPAGPREVPGGTTVVLDEWVNLANCGAPSPCDDAAMDAVTEERRWGENNPRWRLFAWGPLSALVPGLVARDDAYLVVLAADDPSETDGDPGRDGASAETGRGILLLRASAFGPGRSARTLEATVARSAVRPAEAGYPGQRGPGDPRGTGALAADAGLPVRTEMTLADGGMVLR